MTNSRQETPELDVISVGLGDRTYDILAGYDWLPQFGAALRERGLMGEAMVFTSPRIGHLHYQPLEDGLRAAGFPRVVRHDIPDGEVNKNLAQLERALDALIEQFPESGAVPIIMNLGGGVVGDLGAFAASIFRRGVSYVQLPTTLLACVDCGIGGKTGINRGNVKNVIGTFYQPKLVLADTKLLSTLPVSEIRSGTAEIIKYAAIGANRLFGLLEESMDDLLGLDRDLIRHVVGLCYQMKAAIVEKDEKDERGERIVLNFGHTIGHAIEMAADYRMLHGEAISVGMLAITRLSERLGLCEASLYDRLHSLIESAGLPTSARDLGLDPDVVMEILQHDKKFTGGKNCFVLIEAVSRCKVVHDVDMQIVREVVTEFTG